MRPRSFDSADELKQCFDEYLDQCKDKKEIPTLAGFAVHTKTISSVLYKYRLPHHDFSQVMEYIFDVLHVKWFHNGKLSDRMKEFMLKSHIPDTYTERKVTTNINNNIDVPIDDDLTDDQLTKRIQQVNQKLSSLTTPST